MPAVENLPPGPSPPPDNGRLAARLDEVADLLEAQGANVFRVRAYRAAARNLRALARPLPEILAAEGRDGLMRLPGIGASLSHSLEQLVRTGRLGLLQHLRGEVGPEHLFATLPGVGPELAHRLHEQLHIETLPELEDAARDGRLARIPGFGAKRLSAVGAALAARHRPPSLRTALSPVPPGQPSVEELLDVDREYREQAKAGRLPCLTPAYQNPTGDAWLPVLHTQRGPRHYTALYSNTARAHALGMTHDWVVIDRDDRAGRGRWTVITARYRPLHGRRIVRGREAECDQYYAASKQAVPRTGGVGAVPGPLATPAVTAAPPCQRYFPFWTAGL